MRILYTHNSSSFSTEIPRIEEGIIEGLQSKLENEIKENLDFKEDATITIGDVAKYFVDNSFIPMLIEAKSLDKTTKNNLE